MDKLLDEHAFNDAFEANKNYKPDLDHHWLYTFVCYYESAKQARNKHSLPPDSKETLKYLDEQNASFQHLISTKISNAE